MFGNFPFGVPYFGQPDQPSGAITGSGTLIQQSQYFNGVGHIPVAVQAPPGGPLNLSWWRRKVKRITLGGVEISGNGSLEQSAARMEGLGRVQFLGQGIIFSSGAGIYGNGRIIFSGHGRMRTRTACTKSRGKMTFTGSGAIHLKECNPTEEELIGLLLNLDDIL